MAWNEPDNKKDKDPKDPWTGRRKASEADMKEAMAQLHKQWEAFLTYFKSTSMGGPNGTLAKHHWLPLLFLLLGFFCIWIVMGFFVVQSTEEAVVLKFGQYSQTLEPGLHWIPRLIETKTIVNTGKTNHYFYDAHVLTKDQNVVLLPVTVRYRINDPRAYLFNVINPKINLQEGITSAVRQITGAMTLESLLTMDQVAVANTILLKLEQILAKDNMGIEITGLAVQAVKIPDAVKTSFEEIAKSRNEAQKLITEAQADAAKIIATATAQAQQLSTEAQAYQTQVVLKAQADMVMFQALLPLYKQNAGGVREYLYMQTLRQILPQNGQTVINQPNPNDVIVTPSIDAKTSGSSAPASQTQKPKSNQAEAST